MDNKRLTLKDLQVKQRRRRTWRAARRWIVRLLFLILVVFTALYTLIRNERVQNYVIHRVTEDLSKRLETDVNIDRFRMRIFDQIAFQNFYVQDLRGDTLLFAQNLQVNLNTNIFNVLQGRFIVNDVLLEDATVNLHRDTATFKHNIELLLAKLAKKGTSQKQSKSAFQIDLDKLMLRNVDFFKRDLMRGEDMKVFVEHADVWTEKIDLINRHIAIREGNIWGVRMDLEQYPRDETFFNYWYNYVPPTDTSHFVVADTSNHAEDIVQRPMVFTVQEVNLCDGMFFFDDRRKDPIKHTPDDILDYKHLSVVDIGGTVEDFKFESRVFSGDLKTLSFKENSGFVLNELAADSVTVSPLKVELFDLSLTTPRSSIGDTLIFRYKTYEDFMNFKDNVRMDIRFNKSVVAVEDITTFIPSLKNSTFFRKNEKEILHLDGRFTGKINKLKGRDLNLQLGKNTFLKGKFSSRNLAVRNEELLNLDLESLNSTIPALKELIPNFRLPPNFDKLGNINFSGRFDGFFIDFVAYGELHTALGRSTMDMQMKFNEERTDARYSGKLELIDFDLAKWSDDSRFGIVSFSSKVKNGVGLTLKTVDADLSARIETFPFQGYTYRNLTMDGALRQNFFDGLFNIKDEHIDLNFNGAINFENPLPIYDFDANINKLDLKSLNLSKQDFVFAGNIDLNMQGKNLSDMEGQAYIRNLAFVQNDSINYAIDTINIHSTKNGATEKIFSLQSEVADATLRGHFDIQKVPHVFQDFVVQHYTPYAQQFNIQQSAHDLRDVYFDFNTVIKNTKNLTRLIDPKLDTLKDISLEGFVDNRKDTLNFDLDIGRLHYNKLAFSDIVIFGNSNAEKSVYDIGILKTKHKEKRTFAPVNLLAIIEKDTVSLTLNSTNFVEAVDYINIRSDLFITEDGLFQLQFLPSNLKVFDLDWEVAKDNYIRFGRNTIYTKNFRLTNDNKVIELQSEGEQGLALCVQNFNLNIINDYWTYDKLIFDAPFTLVASTQNIFKLQDLRADIVADTFKVNQDIWGVLNIQARMPHLKDRLTADIQIEQGTRILSGNGYYVPPKASVYRNNGKMFPRNYFNLAVDIGEYPLNILEYFIPSGISETVGTFNAKVDLFGTPQLPNIGGWLTVYDGALNIDYLGTRYFIDNQTAKLTNTLFDATGTVITDRMGNTANVFGGIAHDRLKNLELDASLETDRFLALETQKEDNPLFYGTAIGSGIVDFSGPFKRANIDANNVITDKGTKIIIPVSYEQDGSEASFIKFIDRNAINSDSLDVFAELRGLNLTIDLNMTDQAETQLVFDERAGDILKGFGNGNIQIEISRAGDFTMTGNYTVERGDYLFTYKIPNLDVAVINKRFIVKQGGTIRWFGDPLAAQINLDAEYTDITASPYNLIADFVDVLPSDRLKLEARKPTQVELSMNLKGELQQPEISFDVFFPDLRGEINNYTENKLRLLRQDALELNRQVFGLIAIGGFLPSGESYLGGQGGVLLSNTVSQVISNQLSIYLTEFIRESIAEGGPISGIDFDLNYNEFLYDDINNLDEYNRGREVSVRPRLYFWDDRLTVDVGFGIGLEDNLALEGATGRLNSQDIVFEFAISENRRLKIRAYNRYEQTIAGQLNQTGLGLSYRREFDDFKSFFKKISKKKKRKKDKD